MNSCLIIGGGINGLLPAYLLRMAGLEVRLLDKGATGRESSWAGAGILSLLPPWGYAPAVDAMARRGRALWPEWSERLLQASGVDPEYLPCGMAVLAPRAREAAMAWCGEHGEAVAQLPAALSHLGDGDSLWLPDVAQARNPRIMQGLRAAAIQAGVEISEHTAANSLLTDGGRVIGVETTDGLISADIVLVAAGAWSGDLLAEMGHAPEIAPVRGQIVLFKAEPCLLPCVVYRDGHYLVPRADGHILAGSTLEDAGFDKTTTLEARVDLLNFAYGLLPALREAEIVAHWAGLRPGSPGNLPTIGRHPRLENLYVNSGHFRYGVTMAPAAAEVLLHHILGAATPIDPGPYAWTAQSDRHNRSVAS